jgi:hypothetical protein
MEGIKAKDKHVRNRRYKKLQQLMEEGEYFSEDAIKQRAVILLTNIFSLFCITCTWVASSETRESRATL